MKIATIEVSGVRAAAGEHTMIPVGITGASVSFDFTDPRWEPLTKIAVFQGCVTRDVSLDSDTAVIPHETVAEEGCELRIGVYGVDAQQNLVIPTLWATVGMICSGADPSGDPSADPTLPVWAQLEDRMDAMADSLEEQIYAGVEAYLTENPFGGGELEPGETPNAVLSVNGVWPNQFGNVQLNAQSVKALAVTGGTMEGTVHMNGQKITGLNMPVSGDEPATKAYVDGAIPQVTAENDGQILTVAEGKAVWTSVDVWVGGSY